MSKAGSAISEKLADKSLSDTEKAKYENLQTRLSQLQQQMQNQSPSAMVGASTLAALNKAALNIS